MFRLDSPPPIERPVLSNALRRAFEDIVVALAAAGDAEWLIDRCQLVIQEGE